MSALNVDDAGSDAPTCMKCGKPMRYNVPRMGPSGGFVHVHSGSLVCDDEKAELLSRQLQPLDEQAQLRVMRTLVQTMGWQKFMCHVGSLMAEQSDKVDGGQASALYHCSRTVHALDKAFAQCGHFNYPDEMVQK